MTTKVDKEAKLAEPPKKPVLRAVVCVEPSAYTSAPPPVSSILLPIVRTELGAARPRSIFQMSLIKPA